MYMRRTRRLADRTDIYAHRVKLLGGAELDLETFRGHPALIVNTASKCGFTPQYAGLQSLYDRYADRGLRMLGCPSGDFADQEFENAADIGGFCRRNYGVAFPLTERTSVRDHPDPLWEDLGRQPNSGPPGWNFTKYLVGADGHLVDRWPSIVKPEDRRILAAIESALFS
jgi:glutathione peroxidase